jgi:uncharacterized integral membrane protein
MLLMPGRNRLILGLVIVGLILFFIMENSTTVTVYFWGFFELNLPLWVVVGVPFLMGMMAGGLFVWREERKAVRQHQLHGSPALSVLADVAKKRQTKWWW